MTTAAFSRTRVTPASIALLTAGYLFGGIFIGLGFGLLLGSPTPGGAMQAARNTGAGVVVVVVMSIAATAWARELARRSDAADLRRAGWAGAFGFGPVTLVAGLTLTFFEKTLVGEGRATLPLHVLYGMLFVPASFAIASFTALILGIGLRRSRHEVRRLALSAGAAACITYLAVYLVMDVAGWRVGAPEAAKRATMLVVTAFGALGAALSGGAAIGAVLSRTRG